MAELPIWKGKAHSAGRDRHDTQLKPKKKHKKKLSTQQATDMETPLTELRKKIRSLEKLLAHDAEMAAASLDSRNNPSARSMPSQIRQEKERALAGYKHDLDLALTKKTKDSQHRKMITRYHHIRFYERKKAERCLNRAKKELGKGDGSEEAVLNAQVDLYYTLYLPLDVKYVSLWPQHRGNDPDNVRAGASWGIIRETFVQARDDGLNEQEIEDKLLKIRDDGWTSNFGVQAQATQSEDTIQRPAAPLQKASPDGSKNDTQHEGPAPKKSKGEKRGRPKIKIDSVYAEVGQKKGDDAMEDDSDGFFEE